MPPNASEPHGQSVVGIDQLPETLEEGQNFELVYQYGVVVTDKNGEKRIEQRLERMWIDAKTLEDAKREAMLLCEEEQRERGSNGRMPYPVILRAVKSKHRITKPDDTVMLRDEETERGPGEKFVLLEEKHEDGTTRTLEREIPGRVRDARNVGSAMRRLNRESSREVIEQIQNSRGKFLRVMDAIL